MKRRDIDRIGTLAKLIYDRDSAEMARLSAEIARIRGHMADIGAGRRSESQSLPADLHSAVAYDRWLTVLANRRTALEAQMAEIQTAREAQRARLFKSMGRRDAVNALMKKAVRDEKRDRQRKKLQDGLPED